MVERGNWRVEPEEEGNLWTSPTEEARECKKEVQNAEDAQDKLEK